jgi:hypothetical protein
MIAQIAARWIAMNDAITASFILSGTFLLFVVQCFVLPCGAKRNTAQRILLFHESLSSFGERNTLLGAQPIPRMPHQFKKLSILAELPSL